VKPLAVFGVAALLIAPAVWSVTPILYGGESTLPYAGPELSHSAFMGDGDAGRSGTGIGFRDGARAPMVTDSDRALAERYCSRPKP
jgi:hypothetical protein